MGIINAKLRILDKVDNTSDKDKNVAMATKLQTYNTDKSTTYGTKYPLYCYWTGSYYDITVDNYKTRVDLAKSAESVPLVNVNGLQTALDGKAEKLHNHNTSITDWNTATTNGFYVSAAGARNAPVSDAAITGNVSATGNMIVQLVYPESNDDTELISYTRKGIKNNDSITWEDWNKNSIISKQYILKDALRLDNLISSYSTSIIFTDTIMPSDATYTSMGVNNSENIISWYDGSNNVTYISTQKNLQKVRGNSNCYSLFNGCSKINIIDISNFDTSQVTNMYAMFYGCSALTKIYGLNKIDTGNTYRLSYMFYNCSKLKSLDLSNFDTSKVTSMASMFYNCSKLTKLDLSNFNTCMVIDMSEMFEQCTNLKSLDIADINTSKVANMYAMFYGCDSLISLDLSGWNTLNTTDMQYMFSGCNSLTSIKVGDKFKWANKISAVGLKGTWKDETGTRYTSSDTFPSNIAHTYTKVS